MIEGGRVVSLPRREMTLNCRSLLMMDMLKVISNFIYIETSH